VTYTSADIVRIDEGAEAVPGRTASVADYVALLKPRVMSLVVFTGAVGLAVAPGQMHPVLAAIAVLCIAIGAGASGAINMWYDRDIDAIMDRTKARPIPAGRMNPDEALAAGLLAVTIGFYVFVYTMWLKRRTPQNIVIGGAAGAFPPMIGWAAVTGDVSVASIVLFAIIFMWTPPHFWALALWRCGDYARAGVPMLPVVAGDRETRRRILIYALLLAPLGAAPALLGFAGAGYGAVATVLGALFVLAALRVWRGTEADHRPAKQLFGYSILYLFALYGALLVDSWVAG